LTTNNRLVRIGTRIDCHSLIVKNVQNIRFLEMWVQKTAHILSYSYKFSSAFSLDSISRLRGEREKFITRVVLIH